MVFDVVDSQQVSTLVKVFVSLFYLSRPYTVTDQL
jgi:hypothetical protein